MNIIGFSFTKLQAFKSPEFKKGFTKNFNVDIFDVEEEKVPFATKNSALRISFRYEVLYNDPESKKDPLVGETRLEGLVTLMMEDAEAKEFLKVWKGKKVPSTVQEFLVNFILRKCTAKAMELQDSVNLPSHIPIPRAKIGSSDKK